MVPFMRYVAIPRLSLLLPHLNWQLIYIMRYFALAYYSGERKA